MIEKWLQITCDECGETDTSTWPNLSVADFRKDLKEMGNWGRSKGRDLCGTYREQEKQEKTTRAR